MAIRADIDDSEPVDSRTPLWSPFILFLSKALAARRDRRDERRIWLEAAGALIPLDPDSLDRTSMALTRAGRAEDAIRMDRLIAELHPRDPRAQFRLAVALQLSGDHSSAIGPLERVLALDPDFPRGRNNLAAAFVERGERLDEVIPLLEAAVAADPTESEAWINLAPQYCRVFQLEAALEAGERAVALAPNNSLSYGNFANVLKEAQRWDEAEARTERALALSPDDLKLKLNLGLLHLLRGDYPAGWRGYEYRWDATAARRLSRPSLPGPPWRGESLQGKTLLLWGEEGQGDVLQFCRYVPIMGDLVHERGGRLVWNAFPRFGDLLKRSLGGHVDAYVTGGIPLLPPFDYEFPLLSTARLFETRDETIPGTVPYIRADPDLAARWRERLAGETRLKVGLVWTGNPEQPRNPYRSVDARRYGAHFSALSEVAFYSLQVDGEAEVQAARQTGFEIIDHTAEFRTYDDTAAFVDNLDLVITICTSVAHLAGAMGKPTWILLDVNPHWVWRLERRDSPWYPTAILYRQERFAEWAPVLEALARDLKRLDATRAPTG